MAAVLTRPFDWTGFYIGANIGGVLSDYEFNGPGTDGELVTDVDLPFTPTITFFGPSHEDRRGSVIGGGQIGYNQQFGHFVIGVEGDFDRTSERGTASFRDIRNTTFFDNGEDFQVFGVTDVFGTYKAESNWNASARLRFGYAQGPVLIYGTGGAAFADIRVWSNNIASTDFFFSSDNGATADFISTQTVTNISHDDDTFVGWTAGGGVEVAFGEAVSLALEYRHNGFGNQTFGFSSNGSSITPGSLHLDLDSDQVTVRFNVLLCHMFGRGDGFSTGLVQSSAKDKNIAVAPMVEEFSWSGPYIGAHVGGVWTDYDFSGYRTTVDTNIQDDDTGGDPLVAFRTPSIDGGSDDSIIGGGQLGYQWQWGHFVAGVEADFSGMSSGSATRFDTTSLGTAEDAEDDTISVLRTMRSADEKWQASARARLGWAQGHILLYATGGAAWAGVTTGTSAKITTQLFDPANGDGGIFPTFDETLVSKQGVRNDGVEVGWTAGAGAEWAFNNVFSVGMEYRHNEFGDVGIGNNHKGAISAEGSHVSLDSDQVTFKVNVLLGTLFRRQ
ncbi:MAG: outer membrane beta-barrel protein [Spartobacteria bacterium]